MEEALAEQRLTKAEESSFSQVRYKIALSKVTLTDGDRNDDEAKFEATLAAKEQGFPEAVMPS